MVEQRVGQGRMRRRKKIRSRWDIILDILKALSDEGGVAKKTHIMQKAYLDWRNFQKHFNFLLEHGFVGEREEEPEEGRLYYLTEEGRNLLKGLRDVEEALRY
jgi:predicted transcriptional regulator